MTGTFSSRCLCSDKQTLERGSCSQAPFQRFLHSGSLVIYNLEGQLASPTSKTGLAETQPIPAEK